MNVFLSPLKGGPAQVSTIKQVRVGARHVHSLVCRMQNNTLNVYLSRPFGHRLNPTFSPKLVAKLRSRYLQHFVISIWNHSIPQ